MGGIRKAERKYRWLKIGVGGVTGTGKTIGALKLALGICGDWERICVIDSENGSADLYAHLGPYSVSTLKEYTAEAYINAIKEVLESKDFDVMIIDSMTHEWSGPGGILEYVEKIAETKTRGNTYTAWKYGTELHNRFVNSWLLAPIHTICTMRKKDDTIIEKTESGKATPRKVGLKNIQRDGLDYEFDISFDIHKNHHCTCDKDRTMLFDNIPPFELTEEVGAKLTAWAASGKAPAVDETVDQKHEEKTGYSGTTEQQNWVMAQLKKMDIPENFWEPIHEKLIGRSAKDLPTVISEVVSR